MSVYTEHPVSINFSDMVSMSGSKIASMSDAPPPPPVFPSNECRKRVRNCCAAPTMGRLRLEAIPALQQCQDIMEKKVIPAIDNSQSDANKAFVIVKGDRGVYPSFAVTVEEIDERAQKAFQCATKALEQSDQALQCSKQLVDKMSVLNAQIAAFDCPAPDDPPPTMPPKPAQSDVCCIRGSCTVM